MTNMSHVTQILHAIEGGDAQAADQLLPLVYDELRRLAAAQMAREKPGQTLDATGLVHEAYLRLAGQDSNPVGARTGLESCPTFANRRHFFAAAAEAMRRILIENARRKGSDKRGGDHRRADFDPDELAAPDRADDLIALDETLQLLAKTEPQVAELVKLRHFAGLTIKQAAEVLGVSPRTADAWWAYARAWLLAKLQGDT
jgi:RNA polymerase sigma factor (TIGR02999 family)